MTTNMQHNIEANSKAHLLELTFPLLPKEGGSLIDQLIMLLKQDDFAGVGKVFAWLCCHQPDSVNTVLSAVAHYFPLIRGQWLDTLDEAFCRFELGFIAEKRLLLDSIRMFDAYFNGEEEAAKRFQMALSVSMQVELTKLTSGLFLEYLSE